MKHTFFTLVILSTFGFAITQGYAEVRSSTNFAIERDSINTGGGLSTSTSYGLESTAGEIATGRSSSTNYGMHAGYQQVEDVFLSLSAAADVSLSPSLGGVTGGAATGSTFVIATTDAPAGYELVVRAAAAPAMRSGANTIADYAPAGVVPDATFTTTPIQAHFGFAVRSSDAHSDFRINAGVCGSGANTAGSCWDGLSTTNRVVATGGSNYPVGATTTLDFKMELGSSNVVVPGTYVATTTLTLLPL